MDEQATSVAPAQVEHQLIFFQVARLIKRGGIDGIALLPALGIKHMFK